jgi:RNA-directed DNA polymerase
MKRLGDVWSGVVAFDNLWMAWRKARKGKRSRAPVQLFVLDLEKHLLRLQAELVAGTYRPGTYRQFNIYERKPRIISAAPFRDRVVHHAVMNVLEAPLDRRFIFDSYACRVGKGTHAAVDRYQQWARRWPYVLKLDVRRYFPSIDHNLLKEELRRYLKDCRVLELLDTIIDCSPPSGEQDLVYLSGDDLLTPLDRRTGIPIGNLTSQFFANLYLNRFDHWVKGRLGVNGYLRYVDDLVLLSHDKEQLAEWRLAIMDYLERESRLRLHPDKGQIMPVAAGINLLGYQVWPWRRRLANQNGYRFRRRLSRLLEHYHAGRIERERLEGSIQAWIGHAAHADTRGLRRELLSRVHFDTGPGL